MGHKHTKDEIRRGALAAATADGLSQLSFGRVAKHLGINDRTVVYYFPTKDDLVSGVLEAMGLELLTTVAEAFSAPASDYLELARTAWPVLADEAADPVFALFFEANGLAAAGRDPYRIIVPALIKGWIEWASELVEGTPERRQTEAETAIALIDGLLLLRQLAGPQAANRAAQRLGIA